MMKSWMPHCCTYWATNAAAPVIFFIALSLPQALTAGIGRSAHLRTTGDLPCLSEHRVHEPSRPESNGVICREASLLLGCGDRSARLLLRDVARVERDRS